MKQQNRWQRYVDKFRSGLKNCESFMAIHGFQYKGKPMIETQKATK